MCIRDRPNARWIPAPANGVAPDDYHATTIFPEYFKINGSWQLARESRMDCVAVLSRGVIEVKEFRRLKKGDLVAVGRSEDGRNGIYVHATAVTQPESQGEEAFACRQGRARETAYAMDYDSIYEMGIRDRCNVDLGWARQAVVAVHALALERILRRMAQHLRIVPVSYTHLETYHFRHRKRPSGLSATSLFAKTLRSLRCGRLDGHGLW